MKKTTTLLLGFILIAAVSFAQSFQLSATSVLVTGPANQQMTGHVTVTNISSGSVFVKVTRTVNDTLTGHSSYFCWQGACFPPETSFSPNELLMNPNDYDTTIQAYLQPSNIEGNSVVTYCFIDRDSPNDSACVTFNYSADAVGINELNQLKFMSSPFPNPADNSTRISYQTQSGNDIRLVVSNMLGSTVKEIQNLEKKGTFILPTHDLRSGIYFCSIQIDGKISGTKKLIVNHK